ncbi:Hpt domain-containing protein [Arthrobacter sp. C9C5]|nr:Hpt domain-containing protein [Arthrobacter sp. C9C5]
MSASFSGAAPLVDPAALQDLGEQLNSAAVAKGFARDYAEMWGQRYDSLAGALERRDQAAALDAVLSLKTSSSMVGGLRLAELAGELEEAIRGGDLGRAASLLGDVAARGSETVDELQFSYILWER